MRTILHPDWSLGMRSDDLFYTRLGNILYPILVIGSIVSEGGDLPAGLKILFWLTIFPTILCTWIFAVIPVGLLGSVVVRYGSKLVIFGLFPIIGGFMIIPVTEVRRLQPKIEYRRTWLSVLPLSTVLVSGSFAGRKRLALVGARGDPYGDLARWVEDLNRVRQELDPSLPPVEVGDFTEWEPLNLPKPPAPPQTEGDPAQP